MTYRVFNVTSYSENNNDTVNIVGDGSGDPVVFNFAYKGNTNLGGQVTLAGTGLTDDLVMWNFTSSNQNVQLNNNGGTYRGVIVLPNDNFTSDNYNLDGRVYGGADGNMQIVSGANVDTPVMTGLLTNTATVSESNESGSQSASAAITINSQGVSQLATGSSSPASAGIGEILGWGAVNSGTIGVAIELPQGPRTAAELSAIRNAIATLDSQVAPFGVTFVVASAASAASAPVHITMASSSVIGGVNQGVLGAYTPDGDITLISGWNWYFGSAPGKIAQNQYDFQSVVTHELGHVLRLGENSDPASAMDLYLSPGQVRRNLTANDLSAVRRELQASPGPLPASVTPAVSAALLAPGKLGSGLASGIAPITPSEVTIATTSKRGVKRQRASVVKAPSQLGDPTAARAISAVSPADTNTTSKLGSVSTILLPTGKRKAQSRFSAIDSAIDNLYAPGGPSIDLQ